MEKHNQMSLYPDSPYALLQKPPSASKTKTKTKTNTNTKTKMNDTEKETYKAAVILVSLPPNMFHPSNSISTHSSQNLYVHRY